MTHVALVEGVLSLEGNVDKYRLPAQIEGYRRSFSDKTLASIDLANIDRYDSALVALLIEAKRANPNLKITSVSQDLRELFDLYGVLDLE